MDGDREELNVALRAVAAEILAREREHPSAEDLVRHSRGKLPGADQERIQNHLAICPACARLRLALPQLQIGERRPRWRPFAWAAALLVAAGLGWMLGSVRTATWELRPAINLPTAVLTLDPDRQATETLLVPADADFLMIVVPLSEATGQGVYRIRVAHRELPLSWTSPPVESRQGEITLTFAASALRPGLYDLTVDQLLGAGSRRIGAGSLRIRRSPSDR